MITKEDQLSAFYKLSNQGIESLTEQEFVNLGCYIYGATLVEESSNDFEGLCRCYVNLTNSKLEAFDNLAKWFDERAQKILDSLNT